MIKKYLGLDRLNWRCLGLGALCLIMPLLAAAGAPVVLIYGDSLSAGYGLPREAAWPVLLEKRLAQAHLNYRVVNASISGETTAGGLARLPRALGEHRPAVVVLELGANDGLQGLPLAAMGRNLETMVTQARQAGARVLLVGMRLPPNYGAYGENFRQTYPTLAQRLKLPLVDFLLAGMADQPALFQGDGLHPVAAAQPRLLDNVWKGLHPLLKGGR